MSTPQSLVNQLAQVEFFAGMALPELELLARHAHAADHDTDEYLLQRGRPASGFYLITSGRVSLELDAPRGRLAVQTLGAGDVLGISWLIPPHTWQFSARAVKPVSTIFFDTAEIRQRAERDVVLHDDLMTRFMQLMAKRLHATRIQLLDLYQPPAYQGGEQWSP